MVNVNAQSSDYLFMVEQAVKAPSGHNTQPWLYHFHVRKLLQSRNYVGAVSICKTLNIYSF